MKPEAMLHCRFIAPHALAPAVINVLYGLEVYHVTPHLKGQKGLDLSSPLAEAEEISSLLLQLRTIRSFFPPLQSPHQGKPYVLTTKTFRALRKSIPALQAKCHTIRQQLQEATKKEQELGASVVALAILRKLKVDYPQLQSSSHLCHFFGSINKTEGLAEAIQQITDNCSLAINTKHIFLAGKKEHHEAFRGVLQEYGYSPFTVPAYRNLPKEMMDLKKELLRSKEERRQLQDTMLVLQGQAQQVLGSEYAFQEELRKQELPLQFASTEKTIVAEGWIPKQARASVQATLEKVTQGKISLAFSPPGHEEAPPVKLKHQKLITPFEFLLRLYDLPKYHEIDPTSLMFITFPLFFGMMLGDVGYGLVLFGLFWFLRKKNPALKQMMDVLLFAAGTSILFGFAFGEVFGFESLSDETGKALCSSTGICFTPVSHISHGVEKIIWEFPHLLSRAHSHVTIFGFEVLTILVIGALIGFIHLNAGLILGFINEWHHHGLKHAFFAKMSWLILQAGIILSVVAGITSLGTGVLWMGIAIAVAGVIFLGLGEGIQGIVELPSLFSNMLSYMRLGAVGLASVGLAVVVNEELALPLMEKGGIFILIGIIVMLLGHGINLLLGIIGPFLHGVRLHYVEFFSKFFQGGGLPFEPFAKKEVSHEGA